MTGEQSALAPGTLLQRYGLHTRKDLGQHFLVDSAALQRIVKAAQLEPSDVVVEIGPGAGVLTRELLAAAGKVIAIERDESLVALLQRELQAENLHLLAGDALERRIERVLEECGVPGAYKVVANLPYNVGTAVVRRFLEAERKPSCLVVLLQKEVAQNMAARPPEMSLLSVATQLFAVPTLMGLVKPGSFMPPPKVYSAILRLEVRAEPSVGTRAQSKSLLRLAKAGFSAPRKQLVNNLMSGLHLDRERVTSAMQSAEVEPQRRAETLTLKEWGRLVQSFETQAGHAA